MKRVILLFLPISLLLACGSDDAVDVTRFELLPKESALASCTDPLATNLASGFTFDDNSCQYTPVKCSSCDHVIEIDDHIIDNDVLKLPVGATIGIKPGKRGALTFRNFHGTADKPYLIVNCDGKVEVAAEVPGIKLHTSSHIRLSGTGSTDNYGIKISAAQPFGVVAELSTTHFEIDHLEITGTQGPGISARTRPVCDGSSNRGTFTQRNTILHHNYIHDTGGEGFYIGGSHWHSSFPENNDCPSQILLEPELEGVKIYNNIVENTGQDGIQVGGAITGCEIYNNVVINYGLKNIEVHQSGIQINPGTTGDIYSNLIKGGTGSGIFLNGFDNRVFSNLILDCNKNAILAGDREPLPGKSYRIVNNTMVNVNGYAIYMNSKLSVNNIFYNNLIINQVGDLNNKLGTDIDIDIADNVELDNLDEALLASPDQYDYSPLDDSPLIDAGRNIDNVGITIDYLLNNRHRGASIDVGAFEYQKN